MPSYRRILSDTTDDLIREALGPDAYLLEEWSDAARAASAAARKSRAKGGDWRRAGRTAYTRSEAGQKAAYRSTAKAFGNLDKARVVASALTSSSRAATGERRAAKRAEAKGARFTVTDKSPTGKGFDKVSKRIKTKMAGRATGGQVTRTASLLDYTRGGGSWRGGR